MAPDTVAYMTDFKSIPTLFNLTTNNFTFSRYQPFWIILTSFCKLFDSFVLVQIICALIVNSGVFYFFKNTSAKFFTCILFYYVINFFYFNMEIMRESLAVSFFLVSVVKYNNKKYWQVFLFMFIAFMFHQFAAFLFVIPFFLSSLVSENVKKIMGVAFLVFVLMLDDPVTFISNYLSSSFSAQLSLYELVEVDKMKITGYIYALLRILPIIIILLSYRNKSLPYVKLDKKIMVNLLLMYIIIVVIRTFSIPFLERFANYFIMYAIVAIVGWSYDLISKFTHKIFHFQAIVVVAFVSFLFYNLPLLKVDPIFNATLYKRYYPYYSIFSELRDPDREWIIRKEAKE